MPSTWISLIFSQYPSLWSIAFGRSSRLYPVLAHSCCMYVLAGRPAFARPCEGVHWISSLMSSPILLQQCPACLVRLTWIVFVIGGKLPYSCYFVGCYLQDLFNITCSILMQLPSSFFSISLVSFLVVHPYSSNDTDRCLKKCFLF